MILKISQLSLERAFTVRFDRGNHRTEDEVAAVQRDVLLSADHRQTPIAGSRG